MCTMEAGSVGPCEGDLSPRSDMRKSNKPLMEKKRRQRINRCLNDLKTLVLEALKKDPSRYSKLEKADILEMTVRHVQALHRHESANGRMTGLIVGRNGRPIGPDERAKYRAGFNQCAVEVTRYLNGVAGVPRDLHSKIIAHLNSISSAFPQFQTLSQPVASGHLMNGTSVGHHIIPAVSSSLPAPSHVVATAADSSTMGSLDPLPKNGVSQTENQLDDSSMPLLKKPENTEPTTSVTVSAGVTLVPARLANGQMALILPPGTNIPFKSQRESAGILSGSVNSPRASTNADGGTQTENFSKNQSVASSVLQQDVHAQKYQTDGLTSHSVYGTRDTQNVVVGLSVQGPSEYFKTNQKAAFSRYLSTGSSNYTYSDPKTIADPKGHFEMSLPASSSLDGENGTFPAVSTSLSQTTCRPDLSGNAPPVSNERPLWIKPYEKEGKNPSQCSHVAISVSRQQETDAPGSRSDLHPTSQTVLIKPKPQLPTGALFLHSSSPVRCEQSLKYASFASPSSVSSRTAFDSHHAAVAQEPLNLVVTGDERSREESATFHPYSPSSSLSSSLPESSSSSSSTPSPSSSSSPSYSASVSLSLSSPPVSFSATVTTTSSSPSSPSTSSLSSPSRSLKAPSSFQVKRRVAPYEVPVAGSNGEAQPWRPW
ncbi:uncharacterized protein DDB_G0271670-like [Macrobrachium nipponense]|uniref:uncharacterized protein DDB_G0271670-like n=1 Tax=Macrobrachium nipponense TaxID=159736 RepID=UPI0030C81505